MATTYYNDIQKLYVAYFNRPGDPTGLAFWEKAVEASKGDVSVVAAEFAKQVEYTDAYSGMTNAQIVSQVYQNLFGRSSSGDTGADFWVKGLDNKVISIADVVTAVAAGAQTTDLTAFNNKVKAAAAFTAALDTDAEKAGYVGTEANAIAKAFLAGITTDATFAAATAPSQLNATVGSAVAAGTTFTVAGALSTLNAANAAMKSFLTTADGDNDATTSTTDVKLKAAASDAAKVLGGDATATTPIPTLFTQGRETVFNSTDSSASVKAALIGDQTTAYANAISTLQTKVAADQANVAKVAGLADAIAARDNAKTSFDNAHKVTVAADADLAAKVAAYNVNHADAKIAVAADGSGNIVLASDATKLLTATDTTTGKLVLATGITETTNSGITAILASTVAKEAADVTEASLNKQYVAATNTVNHIDMSADVTSAEVTSLRAVADAMGLASTAALPTEAAITTYAATLKDAALVAFNAKVDTYHAAAAASNPVVSVLDGDTKSLSDTVDASADFNAAVATWTAANATVEQLKGYQATVDAAQAAFTKAGYTVVDFGAATAPAAAQVAGVGSDLYIAGGKTDVSINLFGLQGKDAISIGSGYTLNTGKLSTGDDSKLEVFVAQAANGTDTTLKIEAHNFSSHVTGATAPELLTVTLIGVNAANVHLDANGIITVG
nr:DUF4214 domain-containing protein [uncultured Massilia sp.]